MPLVMLGLFSAKCPVDAATKLWVELRMCWLAEVFGLDRMKDSPVVLPSPEWFPDRYERSEDDVATVFRRVAEFMGIDGDHIHLEIHDEDPGSDEPTALGLYYEGSVNERERISINWNEVADPTSLVATVAHELSHAILLGDGNLTTLVGDHEWITDLATVFFGLGVFGANSVMREQQYSQTGWHYFQLSRRGYLSERYYGYALAVFAHAREEKNPDWAKHLRLNVKKVFEQSLRYLMKTGDCLIDSDSFVPFGGTPHEPTLTETLAELRLPSGSHRLAAAAELAKYKAHADTVVPALTQLLEDGDLSIQAEAGRTLGTFGDAARSAVPTLLHLLAHRRAQTRGMALETLGEIGVDAEQVVPEAMSLVSDAEREVQMQAITTLGRLGEEAADAVPQLTQMLEGLNDTTSAGPAFALGQIGPVAYSAIPSLLEIIYHGEGGSRVTATAALAGIGSKSEEVMAALHHAAADHDHEVRHVALQTMIALTPLYQESVGVLEQALRSDDPDTRWRAAWAISKVDGCAAAAVAGLASVMPPPLATKASEWTEHFDLATYHSVVGALRDIGNDATSPLREMLSSGERDSIPFALWALAQIGSAASEAGEQVRGWLNDEDPLLRLLAAFAIWNCQRDATASISAILSICAECDTGELDPAFELCRLDDAARGTSIIFLNRLATASDLHRAVTRLAVREMGDAAMPHLVAACKSGDDSLRSEVARLAAALDCDSGGQLLQRESSNVDHDLATRKWLTAAHEHTTQLRAAKRAHELATMSLEDVAAPAPAETSAAESDIEEAACLLIAGVGANAD